MLETLMLSPHFSYRELTRSDTAIRLGIDNDPTPEHLENLKLMCVHVLEPVRVVFGPVTVNSGYRSMAVNMAVNRMTTTVKRMSKHCLGQAVDFEVWGIPNGDLAKWCVANISDFDQVILEFYTPGVLNSGWVHVSWVEAPKATPNWTPRREVLTAFRVRGEITYQKGIQL